MKKLIIVLLLLIVFLSGCDVDDVYEYNESIQSDIQEDVNEFKLKQEIINRYYEVNP